MHLTRTHFLVAMIAGLATAGLGLPILLPSRAPAIDLDRDGMSDVWQALHGVSTLDRNLDWDLDGASNLLESYFRTDPRLNGAPDDTLDMFGISRLTVAGDIPSVRWPTQNGARYLVQHSDDMRIWIPATSPLEGDGLMINIQLAPPDPPGTGFYRVVALDPGDLDGDRLDLWEERLLGYDPNELEPDGDEDGIPDDWEVYLFGDTLLVTASSDANLDGVTDIESFQRNLNPFDIDTDNDGRSDAAEIAAGTDPASFDALGHSPGPTGLEVFCPLPPAPIP